MLSKRFLKRGVRLLLPVLLLLLCSACRIEITPKPDLAQTTDANSRASAELDQLNIDTYITLNDAQTSITGHGAAFADGVLAITQSGTYSLKGKLSDGRILVNVSAESKVKLLLNGVQIHSTTGAPIFVEKSPKETKILLAEGSENILRDEAPLETAKDSDLFNAVIFSKDDLEINGLGNLTIEANAKGICSKDDLQISGGTLRVTSGDDALRGKDSLEISGGTLTLFAGGDGLRTSNEEKGRLEITGGKITLESAQDAVQSAGDLTISGGTLDLTAGGGYDQSRAKSGFSPFEKASADEEGEDGGVSAKGLKASGSVSISGGTVALNCLDDGVHADRNVTISGGTLGVFSNDDAVHADQTVTVSGGSITIESAYEGLEARAVAISGGSLSIAAIDDGINAAAAEDQSETAFFPGAQPPEGAPPATDAQNGERPARPNPDEAGRQNGGFGFSRRQGGDKGGNPDRYDADSYIAISGGSITVNAGGDGVDTNGDIKMSAGSLTVFGPTNNGNGALDYAGSFEMTGGTILAVGSAGMARGVSKGSACLQAACIANANDELEIRAENGKTLVCVTLPKQIASVVFAGSLTAGKTYTILVNGKLAATAEAK